MRKIGIVGDYDSVKGFAAIGLAVFPVSDPKEASEIIKKLVKEEYAIIYITESLFTLLNTDFKKKKEQTLPIIIPLPGIRENSGIGLDNLRDMAIRAIGSDIVFNKE